MFTHSYEAYIYIQNMLPGLALKFHVFIKRLTDITGDRRWKPSSYARNMFLVFHFNIVPIYSFASHVVFIHEALQKKAYAYTS
jgi:hypothetical protein